MDSRLLEQRVLQVTSALGVSRNDLNINATYVDSSQGVQVPEAPLVYRRRKLTRVGQPLQIANCSNGTNVIINVELRTGNETLEKLFVQVMGQEVADELINGFNQTLVSCSTPEVHSMRDFISAPSPPSWPPIPYIAQTAISRTGGVSVGIAAGFVFGCSFLGQFCLAPFLRRRSRKRKAQITEVGEALLGRGWD